MVSFEGCFKRVRRYFVSVYEHGNLLFFLRYRYRKHYLPNPKTWSEPEASPLLYPSGWETQPKALVVVGELDVLRSEGEAYAEKLTKAGVSVDLKVMKGMPHPFLAMDGVLQQGRDTITYMVEALKEAFA
tara:strand:- start:2001 stop:2390 length:390 start_codon:yes stop_codon:yes gene_type:complete